MDRVRVLLVDDEPDIREIFREQFELEKWQVFEAESVKQGLEILRREKVQVVLSDVRMPGGSGMDLLASMKAELPHPLPLFFFVSGFTDTSQQEVQALGAADLFAKPFDLGEVVVTIKKMLRSPQRAPHDDERP